MISETIDRLCAFVSFSLTNAQAVSFLGRVVFAASFWSHDFSTCACLLQGHKCLLCFLLKLGKVLRLVLDKIPRNQLAGFLCSDFTENAPLVQYTFTVFAIFCCWT